MIVPATVEHFKSSYGDLPVFSMRAYSVINHNGDVIGIGGIYNSYGNWVAFVKIEEELLKDKRKIIQLKKKVMPLIRGRKVYAVRDEDLETSEGVLKHFGFQPVEGNLWLGHPM